MSFSPSSCAVTKGSSLTWHNADGVTHTATANNGCFNTGNIAPGGSATVTVACTTGTLAYHCAIHPSMVGNLSVN
jgi:plastocyanin